MAIFGYDMYGNPENMSPSPVNSGDAAQQAPAVECPQCKRHYPAGTWKCLHDGFLLPPSAGGVPRAGAEDTVDATDPAAGPFAEGAGISDTTPGDDPAFIEAATAEDAPDVVEPATRVARRPLPRARRTAHLIPGPPPTPKPPPKRTALPLPPPPPLPAPPKDRADGEDATAVLQRDAVSKTPPPNVDLDEKTVVKRDAKSGAAVDPDDKTFIKRDGGPEVVVDPDDKTYIKQDGGSGAAVDHEAQTYIQRGSGPHAETVVLGAGDGDPDQDPEAATRVRGGSGPALASEEASQMVGQHMGAHALVRLIREGRVEWIYEARNAHTQERSALRVIQPRMANQAEGIRKYFEDADTVNRIGHRNIVEVFEQLVDTAGDSYQVTELLEGEDLESLLKRQRRLPARRIVGVVLQVCSALKTAHGAMILHRDLRPEHIFLTSRASRDDLVKVLDFGVAKLLDELPPELQRTVPPSPYWPPERFAERPPKDPRSDIYSVGVLLYRALGGQLPLPGADGVTVPQLTELAPEVSPALNQVVMCCLAQDAAARYPNMVSVERALQTAVQEPAQSPFAAMDAAAPAPQVPLVLDPSGSAPVVAPSGGRRMLTIMVAAFLTLGLGAGGLWAYKRYGSSLRAPQPAAAAAPDGGAASPVAASLPAAEPDGGSSFFDEVPPGIRARRGHPEQSARGLRGAFVLSAGQ